MKQKIKHIAILTTILTVIIVGVFGLAYLTANASNRFNFSGQGIVSENNIGEKYIRVSFKQISKQAVSLAGDVVTIKTHQAKVYKPNAEGITLKQTQSNIGVGMLVNIYGTVKADYSFSASKITIVPRKFTVRGKLIAMRKDSKVLTVEISASNYQPTKYVGKSQEISYTDKLTVLHSGGKKDVSKVEPLNQRVVISGNILQDDVFEAVQMSDPL